MSEELDTEVRRLRAASPEFDAGYRQAARIRNDLITLWDAYRQANRRRAALKVTRTPSSPGFGNERTELSLRVSPHLVGGMVAVQQGTMADWVFVDPDKAREIEVTRDL